MPIHEYRCTKCSHRFDFFQRSSAARAPKECPKCGAKKPTKLLSTFGVNAGASAKPSSMGNGGGSCCSGGGCGCR